MKTIKKALSDSTTFNFSFPGFGYVRNNIYLAYYSIDN